MFFKNIFKKKIPTSNSPLKKDNYQGNIFSDESNIQTKTQQAIEEGHNIDEAQQSSPENNANQVQVNAALDEEVANMAGDGEDLENDPKLKKFLKKLLSLIKKKKKKSISNLNTDLAPSLGNDSMTESSLTKGELKKKRRLIKSLSMILTKNATLRAQLREEAKKMSDVKMQDLDHDGIKQDVGIEKASVVKKEHIKQFADAVNDLGQSEKKGRWAEAFSDSHIKGGGKGGGRGGGMSR